MQFLLTLYSNEAGWTNMTPEQQQQGYAAYIAYTEALKKAGAYVGSNRLRPVATASIVHVTDGKSQVLNGPYADTKEQLGGYYLIEAGNLDEAVGWASKMPHLARGGSVEVRPIWELGAV